MRHFPAAALCVALLSSIPAHAETAHPHGSLISVARRFIGGGNFTHFRGPWCAASVGQWLHMAGYHRLVSLRAIDYAHYGRPSGPRTGSIVVMRHHVGLLLGMTAHGPLVLSGNHRHKVGIGVYSARKIIAYRKPV